MGQATGLTEEADHDKGLSERIRAGEGNKIRFSDSQTEQSSKGGKKVLSKQWRQQRDKKD